MIKSITEELYNKKDVDNIILLPVNIVKELVENSIDSGATQIAIFVEDSGWGKITVADNGAGIYYNDASMLCQYQNTSKIEDKYEIMGVKTLGFRGLALHQISIDCQLDIISSHADSQPFSFSTFNRQVKIENVSNQEFAMLLNKNDIDTERELIKNNDADEFDSINMELINVDSKSASDSNVEYDVEPGGTIAHVSKIFYYNPEVRQERNDQLCLVGINRCVRDFILSNAGIYIKYYVDNQLIYEHNGGGRKNAINTVYGQEFCHNSLKIDWFYHGVAVNGYIGKPCFGQASNTLQTVSVNNRIVESPLLLNAVNDVYRYYLIENCAFFAINISIMHKDVDVNVSANKSSIEFCNAQRVYDAVKESVKKTLQYNHIANERAVYGDDALKNKKLHKKSIQKVFNLRLSMFRPFEHTKEQEISEKNGFGGADADLLYANHSHIRSTGNKYYQLDKNTSADFINILTMMNGMRVNKLSSHPLYSNARFLGMVFDRYILLERGDFFYIIDYYSARARAYYDFYLEQCKSNVVSVKLKEPYIFKVGDAVEDYLETNRKEFARLGIYFRQLQSVYYRLDRLPLGLASVINVECFVENLLINSYNFGTRENSLTPENIGRLMCRYLELRANELTTPEIRTFLKTIDRSKLLTSPEGKPIVVVYHKVEFERRFNRKT